MTGRLAAVATAHARILARLRTAVLLLDEPYQGFDQGSYLDFWHHAGAWRRQGRAVVVVTHLLTELDRADQVVELRNLAQGGPQE